MSAPVFTFSQISQALASRHEVTAAKYAAFQSRLKHYQKQGFPAGTNTGRGRAANYSIEHVVKLNLALELNQMGLTPERAVTIARLNLYRWSIALRIALRTHDAPDPISMFIYFDPSALSDLRAEDGTDLADASFHYGGVEVLKESLSEWSKDQLPRLALINISAMASALAFHLAAHTDMSAPDLLRAMQNWADKDHDDGDDPQA